MDAVSLMQKFYEKICLAAQSSKPKIKIGKLFPKPLWNIEIWDKRERFYKIYKKVAGAAIT